MRIPDLTFPLAPMPPRTTPWDLRALLHRGAAAANRRFVAAQIKDGKFGPSIRNRVPIVLELHAFLTANLEQGGSTRTLGSYIDPLRCFYAFVDGLDRDPTKENIQQLLAHWIENERLRVLRREIKASSFYESGQKVTTAIASALDMHPRAMKKAVRLYKYRSYSRSLGPASEKQNVADTFAFGNILYDIVTSLPASVIFGKSLPVTIRFRNGAVCEQWCGLQSHKNLKSLSPSYPEKMRQSALEKRVRRTNDSSLRTRHSVVNRRIEAELLIFIAQTGMNLAQANTLEIGDFRYESWKDGYAVRRFKNRRLGEVEFEIFTEYRTHFEKYLSWLSEVFQSTPFDRVFPIIAHRLKPDFKELKKIVLRSSAPWVSPQALRKTRINWLQRRGCDDDFVAEQAQHAKATLLSNYDRPNHQRAAIETTRFWTANDPCITPPAPGKCVERTPAIEAETPNTAPQPDCLGAAGCLFCTHHRDIDSFDHVWSLASYGHLKQLELSLYRQQGTSANDHPAFLTIERITQKLQIIQAASSQRSAWVSEAINRVIEEDYHPAWSGFIQIAEGI